jgi:parallel beta-helix repeat protein
MSYKRVVEKKGKTYGPYMYESYRDKDGKVRKRYLGKHVEQKDSKSMAVAVGLLLISVLVLSTYVNVLYDDDPEFFNNVAYSFIPHNFIGHATLNLGGSYLYGEEISGDLTIKLKKGELIPGDSLIVVEQGDQTLQFDFSEIVELNANGSFYVEEKDVQGSGEGYGFFGEKKEAVDVHFTLVLSDSESEEETNEEVEEEVIEVSNETEGAEEELEVVEEPAVEEMVEELVEEVLEEVEEEVIDETVEEMIEELEEPVEEVNVLTGSVVVNLGNEVSGVVSLEEDFEYNIADGKDVEIKDGSVYSAEVELGEDVLDLEFENGKAVVSTDYYLGEEGFGAEYLLDEEEDLEIDLADLGLLAIEEEMTIKLVYQGVVLAEIEQNINLESGNGTIFSEQGNFSIIDSLPEVEVQMNVPYVLDLSKYFSGADYYFVSSVDNLSFSFSGDALTIVSETNFLGERNVSIEAYFENETLSQNLKIVVLTSGVEGSNLTVETKKYQIVINRPVKWHKKISTNNLSDLKIELPKEAMNVSVKEGNEILEAENAAEGVAEVVDSDRISLITGNVITGMVSLEVEVEEPNFLSRFYEWFSRRIGITGRVIDDLNESSVSIGDLSVGEIAERAEVVEEEIEDIEDVVGAVIVETGDEKIVLIEEEELGEAASEIENENETEVLLEYYTDAPTSNETEIEGGKRVVISAAEELGYEDILAYTEFDNSLGIVDSRVIGLYWYNNDSGNNTRQAQEFDAYDLDGEGNIDYVEWIVPHLSSQVYDVVINATTSTLTSTMIDGNYAHLSVDSGSAPYDDLVGYWNFDADGENTETTTHYDFSQYENDGIGVGNAVVNETDCLYGDCLDLDGDGDFVSVSYDSSLYWNGTSNFTWMMWVKPNNGEWLSLFRMGEYSQSNYGYSITFTGSDPNIGAYDNRFVFGCSYNSAPLNLNAYSNPVGALGTDWTHVAYSFTSGGGIFYVDGSAVSMAVQGDGCDAIGTEGMQLAEIIIGNDTIVCSNIPGGGPSCPEYSNALKDEVMMFNKSLSGAEITAIYQNTSSRFVSSGNVDVSETTITSGYETLNISTTLETLLGAEVNLSVDYYDGSWTSTTAQAISSDVNFTYSISKSTTGVVLNYTLIPDSNNFYTPLLGANSLNTTVNTGDATAPAISFEEPTPDDAETVTANSVYVNMSSADGEDYYSFVDFGNDLLLWLRMDDVNGSGDPTDLSSYGNNGSLVGNTVINSTSGNFGNGAWFDGTGDYIQIPTSSSLDFYSEEDGSSPYRNYTWSMWVKRDASAGTDVLFEKGESGNGYKASIANGITLFSSKSGEGSAICADPLVGTDWTHLVFMKEYNHTTAVIKHYTNYSIYVNGVLCAEVSEFQGLDSLDEDLFIGNGTSGLIDEFMMFNRSLSDVEILALYNSSANLYYNNFTNLALDSSYPITGYAVDSSGNKNQTETRTVTLRVTNVTGCQSLGSSDTTYTLQNNISASGNCLSITAKNVTLDFAGYNLTGDGTGTGLSVSTNGTLIKNGSISGFSTDFSATSTAQNLTLEDMTIDSYSFGGNLLIYKSSSYGEIEFLEAVSGTGNNLSSDIFVGNATSYVNSSIAGLNKSAQITFLGVGDRFVNTTMRKGTGPCTDCVNLTALNAEIVIYTTGSWTNNELSSQFYTPGDISTCGTFFASGTYTLTENQEAAGDCFHVESNDVIIDFDGYKIVGTGSQSYAGIRNNKNRTVIKDGNITNFYDGIYMFGLVESPYNNTIENMTISGGDAGINPLSTNNLSILGCRIENALTAGIIIHGEGMLIRDNVIVDSGTKDLEYGSGGLSLNAPTQNARIINNTVSGATLGIYTSTSGNNNITIENNNFVSNSYGMWLWNAGISSENWTISGGNVSSNGVGIYLRGANNLTIKDLNISGSTGNDVVLNNFSGQLNHNVTFLNVTYDLSKEIVDEGSNMSRAWYFEEEVWGPLESPVEGVEVNVTNSSSANVYSDFTSVTGMTIKGNLVEYTNNGTGRYFATPHIVNTSGALYVTNLTTYNLTEMREATDGDLGPVNVYHNVSVVYSDVTAPTLSIDYPVEGTNYSVNVTKFNYTYSDDNVGSCWYSVNGGLTNQSVQAAGTNFTGLSGTDGNNTWTLYCNDSVGNNNSASVTFYSSAFSDCGTLDQANLVYEVLNDIVNDSTCFNITSNNVTLDLNGFSLTGDGNSGDYGVHASGYNDSYILDGRVSGFGHGIYLISSSGNNITNITSSSNAYQGILISYGSNNNLTNLTIDSNSGEGVLFALSSTNNIIMDSILQSSKWGELRFNSDSDNNQAINNSFWNCSTGGEYHCISLETDSNTLIDNKINFSAERGIWVKGNHNVFKNMNMTNIAGTSVDMRGMVNNTFTNVTYDTESVATGGELIRKWYYKTYVNDTSGNLVTGATVNLSNSSGVSQFNLTTDASGYTSQVEIIEYVNLGGTRTNYSDYIVGVENSSYAGLYDLYAVSGNDLNSSFTVYNSCLSLSGCTEDANCTIDQDCALYDSLCSDSVCDFLNFTINSTLYTLYSSDGKNANNLTLNLTGTNSFLSGNAIDFSGNNGTLGGQAGTLNITMNAGSGTGTFPPYNLFNTTGGFLRGLGGSSSGSGNDGGNGGSVAINYWGLLRKFTDVDDGEPDNSPVLSGGSEGTGGAAGSAGSSTYNRDTATLPRDVDVNDNGRVTTADYGWAAFFYNDVPGDVGYTLQRDVNNDSKLDVIELVRIGFEYDSR